MKKHFSTAFARCNDMFTKQFILFLVAGLANTIFGYTCYIIFFCLGATPWLALLLATCLAVVFNFVTYGRYVFRNLYLSRFWYFLLTFTSIYFLNTSFLIVLIGSGVHPILAQGLLVPFISVISFYLQKYYVFRGNKNSNKVKTG